MAYLSCIFPDKKKLDIKKCPSSEIANTKYLRNEWGYFSRKRKKTHEAVMRTEKKSDKDGFWQQPEHVQF